MLYVFWEQLEGRQQAAKGPFIGDGTVNEVHKDLRRSAEILQDQSQASSVHEAGPELRGRQEWSI